MMKSAALEPRGAAATLASWRQAWRRRMDRLRTTGDGPGAEATPDAGRDPLEAAITRRLVFVVSTGRSGTEYLTKVLALFRDVHAEHEPEPSFTNAFRTIAARPDLAREFWVDYKLPAIARIAAPVYAETSHLTCKGFLESAIEIGLRPSLVHLVRPYRATASSMLALNTVPSRTYNGVRFYLGPDDRVMLPVPRHVYEGWHDYQLCYWYCLEIGERARVYAERFGPLGVAMVRVELDDLSRAEGVEALGRRLDLGPFSPAASGRLQEILGRRTNTKDNKKRGAALSDADLDRYEREVHAAVAAIEPPVLQEAAG